ncbi:tRNA-splicing endonuclease subunit Sen34 [Morphnus guianensis]
MGDPESGAGGLGGGSGPFLEGGAVLTRVCLFKSGAGESGAGGSEEAQAPFKKRRGLKRGRAARLSAALYERAPPRRRPFKPRPKGSLGWAWPSRHPLRRRHFPAAPGRVRKEEAAGNGGGAAGADDAAARPQPPPPASPPPGAAAAAAVRLWLQRGRVLVWGAAAARALRERHRVSGVLVGAPPRRGRGPRLPLQLLPEEARLLAESGAALLLTPPEPGEGPDPELEPSLAEGQDRDCPPHSGSPTDPPGPPQALLVQLPTARGGPPPPAPHPPPDLGRPSPHWPHGGRPGHERRYRVYRDLWGRGLHLTAGGKFGGDFLVYPGPPERFHAAAVALCPPRGRGCRWGGWWPPPAWAPTSARRCCSAPPPRGGPPPPTPPCSGAGTCESSVTNGAFIGKKEKKRESQPLHLGGCP